MNPDAGSGPAVTVSKPGHRVVREFRRFLVAGSIAFGVDFSVLVLLKEVFAFQVLIANLFSFSFGLATISLLSVYWVYERRVFNRRSGICNFHLTHSARSDLERGMPLGNDRIFRAALHLG